MVSLVFIIFASMAAAGLERLENKEFYRSVFRKLNPRFWNKSTSKRYQKTFAGYPVDAWFCFQTFKISCISLAIVCYVPITIPFVDLFLYTGTWIFNFDTFYNLVFKAK